MKTRLFSLFVVAFAATNLFASDIQVDGIWYDFDDTKLTASVTYRGSNYYNYDNEYTGSVVIPAYVSHDSKTYSVTTIRYNAFAECSGLTSVTIPNSVTTIGKAAFDGCSSLISVTIPNSVTTIGGWTFGGCSALTSPIYNAHIFAYLPGSYKGVYSIPEGIKHITDGAFSTCMLTSVIIPSSVTTIGKYAFYECNTLASITINAITPPSLVISNVDMGDVQLFPSSCVFYVPCGTQYSYKTAWGIPNSFVEPAPNYQLYIYAGANGSARITTPLTCSNDVAIIYASPNQGYHFTQWNDGNKSNPRKVVVTQDTSFTASFAINTYVLTVLSNDDKGGNVIGSGTFEHNTKTTISASANEHYHFVQWSDGNTSNPRTITVTSNKTYTAVFALDQHTITTTATNGVVSGSGTFEYGKEITLTVTPNFGYEFVDWTDGNTDNPRSFVVTRDSIFTAQMDTAKSGRCGENLYWQLENDTLIISGTGAMYDYTETSPAEWYLSQNKISKFIFENSVTHIGNYAFYGYEKLITISLPNSVESIGESAFANCTYLTDVTIGANVKEIGCNAFAGDYRIENITCYAPVTPNVCYTTFSGINKHLVYLYVPADYQRKYQVDPNWSGFSLHLIGAEEKPITGDDVVVTPSTDNATFIWPQNDQAAGYSIEITKDGVVFCTLKFNANGQLTGIAFAPSRDGEQRTMPAAEMTANGWQFTVTGLNQASKYGYTIDALNASQQSIKHYEGEFYTDGYTGLEDLTIDKKVGNKFIYDNQLYLRRGDKIYNAAGVEL